ncbi:MAG: RluA family pseudouridine synthase [Acidobacteriota bacterium]
MEKKIFNADKDFKRLDHFINHHLKEFSRSEIEKLIKDGYIKIDNKTVSKKSRKVNENDIVELLIPDKTEVRDIIPGLQFEKLYEDEHLLIINKPPGISVHPGAGERKETILDNFIYQYPEIKNISVSDRPGIVHRLDKGTSGVLILAKNEQSLTRLQKQFKKREIKKEYIALVDSKVRFKNGSVNLSLTRSRKDRRKFIAVEGNKILDAREALTNYSLRYQFMKSAYLKVSPETGRTHQIRVHLSHIGNPVLGDELYGKSSSFPRLALHAFSITFSHPEFKQIITAKSPIPFEFIEYMKNEIKKKY